MWGTSDRPLLTLADVRAWQTRKQEIEGDIQALRDEDAQLSRKLEAVQILFGELPAGDAADDAGRAEVVEPVELVKAADALPSDLAAAEKDAGQGMSFSDTVLAAVSTIGGNPLPKTIRAWVRQYGGTEFIRSRADNQYFYTIIMRHTENGRLIKVGDGYSLPTSSAQAETGGLAPPVASASIA